MPGRSSQVKPRVGFSTSLGTMYLSTVEDFLHSSSAKKLHGKVQLIFTSPPFPLNTKKKYDNLTGDEYLAWLKDLAPRLTDLLTPDGSIVIELGNAWEEGEPVMSTLALRALLAFQEAGELKLCQQFICNNPARLPSPIQWVNVERVRVKDSFTHVWWLSPSGRPKADNKQVLAEYSPSMKRLLKRQSYNAGRRPSEHNIGETSFLTDHGGAIPSNVLTISNTHTSPEYLNFCKEHKLERHPARMQPELVEFFLRFLTEKDDLVFDPFGGSNTTGAVAEQLERRWLATEPTQDYVTGAVGRFLGNPTLKQG